ncbi:hypothetical protein EV424DRAFT_1299676, partial [Suillus variegatus]
AISMPGTHHSNQIGELIAVLVAIQSANPLTPIKIITDSKYVTDGLNTHLEEWENKGWIEISNTLLFRAIAYQIRRRPTPTTFEWVKGHSGVMGNEQADILAQQGALKPIADTIDTYVPRNFDLQGAKLSKITQQLAYKAILNKTHLDYHRPILALLDVTRFAIERITSTLETDEAIWKSCRHKDISKKIQMFIYKTLNNAYRIGDFWLQIPTFEHRARCQACGEDAETMEHIIVQCNNPTRTKIWHLASKIWPVKHSPWPETTIGLVLGCGALSTPQEPRDRNEENPRPLVMTKGASRLLRILVSESAYLVWTLRCEQAIRGQTYTDENVTKRWANTINQRLQLDRAVASKTRRTLKAVMQVLNTWADIIDVNNNKHTDNDWITNLEVL